MVLKIKDRGYWISKLYRYQSFVYGLICAVYFRDLTFFSATNSQIYLGGMLDDKKSDIYSLVPTQYVPQTKIYQAKPTIIDDVVQSFEFPIIVKPNIGFKGFLVKKMDNPEELSDGLKYYEGREILVQEFLKEPKEYSVMYYRLKKERTQGISSLVEKHMPTIIGNGHSNLKALIEENPNPFLNRDWLLKKYKNQLDDVLESGEMMVIDHVGNYSRGAKFENLNHEIDKALIEAVVEFFREIQGFNFCRLDVKARSLEDLKNGRFKLLEINGAKSEPLHIYDPSLSWWKIMADITTHWKILFKVVKENRNITDGPSTAEGIKSWRSLKKMVN